MPRTPAVLLALAACSLRPHDFDAQGGGTTEPADSTGAASTTGVTTSTTSTSGGATGSLADTTGPGGSTGGTSSPFIVEKDGGPGIECDILLQDCPEGQKCMPYSSDGDNSWDSIKCVPLVPNPDGLYQPCQVFESGVSGRDTCDIYLMCWNPDPDTGVGVCYGQCMGSWENPTCADPQAYCNGGRGVLSICIPACDPILQNCGDGDLCIPNPGDPDGFTCALDASGEQGQAFDACEYANACDPGLLCGTPALASECDPRAVGCCAPFCDLSSWTCPGQDQQCLPWFEEGQAPPGYENVGVCGLPQ